ncbi:response regulator transcription factor [bacterium SCSIO 12741]|nr:response regulator transcription factor [bacterium SCSIO 12741]
MKDLKIVHAEAEPLAHFGLKALLGEGGGIQSIEHCENSDELKTYLQNNEADLVILDYDQSGFFSPQDLAWIKKEKSGTRVLIISSDNNNPSIISILERGVDGFLTRQCDRDEIINAIFAIAKGEKFYCNKIVDVLMERTFAPQEKDNCDPTSLSNREIEITQLIAEGFTTPQIADKLCLSPHTVSTHRKNILKKLDISSVSALINYAYKSGLVREEPNS